MSGNLQYRPAGGDGPVYAPQRDLAYLYRNLFREAFRGLDQANWSPLFQPWAEAANLTEELLEQGVQSFITAHSRFMKDPHVPSASAALDDAGFFELPRIVQVLIYFRLGEAVTAGVFHCVREVTQMGRIPSKAVGLAEMTAECRLLFQRLTGKPRQDPTILEQQAAIAEERVAELEPAYKSICADLDRVTLEKRQLHDKLTQEIQQLTDELKEYEHVWYRRIARRARRFLRRVWPGRRAAA